MSTDADVYEHYYTEKLWELLPLVHRITDAVSVDEDGNTEYGALREMVERIGAQAAVVRRSIDRLWEDQSIETCDDWVIAYMADLLATNLIAGIDARGRRLDVAKTVHYRRRKGTVAVLEEVDAAAPVEPELLGVVEGHHPALDQLPAGVLDRLDVAAAVLAEDLAAGGAGAAGAVAAIDRVHATLLDAQAADVVGRVDDHLIVLEPLPGDDLHREGT